MKFEIFPDLALVRVTLSGTCDLVAFQDYRRRLTADPRFDPAYRRLIDTRDLIGLPSPQVIRGLVEDMKPSNPQRVQVAFVAPNDGPFGMFRMLESLSDVKGYRHRAFRRLEDAEAWLDLGLDRHDGTGAPAAG